MSKLKKILPLTFFILVIICTSACDPKEKVFSKDGMSITLTDEFEEKEYYDFNAYYDTEEAQVYIMKEDFKLLEENDQDTNASLEEYAQSMMKSGSIDAEIKNEDGLTYFNFEKEFQDIDGKYIPYKYYAVVYKSHDAYWLFQFACEEALYSKYEDIFIKWAKSVKFY